MKKLLALVSAFAMLLALASCGEEPAETSSAAPTPAPASSAAPTVVPTIEPVPTPEPVADKNLAHAEDATYIDMNTGKTADDEGYLAYYNAGDTVDIAFDGSVSTGWQLAENLENGEAEQAEKDPDHYYIAEGDGACYKKTAFKDGTLWVGVTFAEPKTVNNVKIIWEIGSTPKSYEDGGYYLQFTADGEKWEKLKVTVTRDEESRAAEGFYVDDATFDAKEVKGVRIVVLEGNTKYAPKVVEMELYAPEEEAAE